MDHPIACIALHDVGWAYAWVRVVAIWGVLGVAAVGFRWKFLVQWVRGIRGRDWAKVSATVDIVTVVAQTVETRGGPRVVGYVATLTYFYRNPELQTGDYTRMFTTEAEAQAWGDSYKGTSVMVHVDPRDASRSVLRKEEL